MSPQLSIGVGAAAATALLARVLEFDQPPAFDKSIRRRAQAPAMNGARRVLAPLFPIGLPGAYITIAYAVSYWLRRKRRRGGPAIVTSAWLGWLVHRAMKLGYRRERPLRPGVRRRTDSYPSGHTTGATALALTLAYVLFNDGLISARRAAAIAIGAPALMGAYRVIADDHWATDVVGGWLLGGAIAATCNAMLAELPRTALREAEAKSPPKRRRGRRERPSSLA
jgi:membrane-associated phospholipid phosphatase